MWRFSAPDPHVAQGSTIIWTFLFRKVEKLHSEYLYTYQFDDTINILLNLLYHILLYLFIKEVLFWRVLAIDNKSEECVLEKNHLGKDCFPF